MLGSWNSDFWVFDFKSELQKHYPVYFLSTSPGMAQNLWSKRFLIEWLVTGEGSYFDWVWAKESLVIELIDHIVHLDFWVLGL